MKDSVVPILKALAAAFLVMAVSGVPLWLKELATLLGVSVFFYQGLQFQEVYLDNERTYIKRKLRAIYVPFLAFSLFFLVAHNFFAWIGMVGPEPAAANGASAYYSFAETSKRMWAIVFGMCGYDSALCQLYWLFRAMLVGVLAFFGARKVAGLLLPRLGRVQLVGVVALVAFVLLLWMQWLDIKVPIIPGGGYPELLVAFLIALGYLYRQSEQYLPNRLVLMAIAVVVLGGVTYVLQTWLAEPTPLVRFLVRLPAMCCGFVLLHQLAEAIAESGGKVAQVLEYIGHRWLYVIAFSFLAFKFSGLFVLLANGLPWSAISEVPVVGYGEGGSAWAILHWICGFGLPILAIWRWNCMDAKYNLTPENCLRYTLRGIILLGKWIAIAAVFFARNVVVGSKWFYKQVKNSVVDFFSGVKDIVNKDNIKDE
ncbi:MAG: hypothetical protein PUH44_01520 [Bacteroidales bacterium]|nr:hypothetical protein [Bacteroidales bacterium]MDY2705430.1 hypothetical protein [Alloprevotella sp.]